MRADGLGAGLKIGSRKSPLAMAQSEYAAQLLMQLQPGLKIDIIPFQTQGDTFLDKPLQDVGGKGLFVKELEKALLEGEIHLALHSMKDMPPELPEGLALLPFAKREDARDAFVSERYTSLDALPAGAVVGTSSLRRQALLAATYPNLQTRLLRGNVNTRLAKLAAGDYDAIILASAGLNRLGLSDKITAPCDPEIFVPACGQGTLAVEFPAHLGWLRALLSEAVHYETQVCWQAESALQQAVAGNCHTPLGAYARRRQEGRDNGEQFELFGFLASDDLTRFARGHVVFPAAMAAQSAQGLAETLRTSLGRGEEGTAPLKN